MPVKEQGFSLLEVLIAMAISSVLLLGAARFLPALQRESLTSTRKLALETLRGATSCEGKGWDKVTNPDAIIIDTFQVVRQDVSGFSPVLTVNMRAASKSEPQTVVNASYSVTGFNL